MILIADSGSTKTDWALVGNDKDKVIRLQTAGINPYQMPEDVITSLLRTELRTELHEGVTVDEVWFYGSGCTKEKAPVVANAIRTALEIDAQINVYSDMLGAARALCGKERGIVCILGTGSNSCLYDGKEMVANVSPLGFILGDEGSGAYIGKRLVGDVLKRQLPDDVCEAFLAETGETAANIIQHVYREPMPNRYLASFAKFCGEHKEHPAVRELLKDCFRQFFIRNTKAYGECEKVNFVGSVAFYCQDIISEVAEEEGYELGKVLRSPIEGLIDEFLR